MLAARAINLAPFICSKSEPGCSFFGFYLRSPTSFFIFSSTFSQSVSPTTLALEVDTSKDCTRGTRLSSQTAQSYYPARRIYLLVFPSSCCRATVKLRNHLLETINLVYICLRCSRHGTAASIRVNVVFESQSCSFHAGETDRVAPIEVRALKMSLGRDHQKDRTQNHSIFEYTPTTLSSSKAATRASSRTAASLHLHFLQPGKKITAAPPQHHPRLRRIPDPRREASRPL